MQKAWLGSRWRIKIRQRAQTRLKSHIKWRNPPTKSADFNLFKVKNLKIKTVFNLIYYRDFCSALNEPAPCFVIYLKDNPRGKTCTSKDISRRLYSRDRHR